MKIDAIGLICPEPIMLLHKAIYEAKTGDVVELIATDPASVRDVKKFCEFLNHELISSKKDEDKLIFKIKKASK